MKKLILSLLVFGFNLTATLAQTTGSPNKDEAAIRQVIEAEKTTLDAADYKAYLTYWAKVPYASFLYDGQVYVGDVLWKTMDQVWATRKPSKTNNIRSNWNIHTKGEAAYVTFNQRVENLESKWVLETAEARYLEKMNGEWKIVSVVAMRKPEK